MWSRNRAIFRTLAGTGFATAALTSLSLPTSRCEHVSHLNCTTGDGGTQSSDQLETHQQQEHEQQAPLHRHKTTTQPAVHSASEKWAVWGTVVSWLANGTGKEAPVDVPLTIDKLRCQLPSARGDGDSSSRSSSSGRGKTSRAEAGAAPAAGETGAAAAAAEEGGGGGGSKPAVVLVSCGSFNPPTVMHLRMFDLAAHELRQRGHDVLGGYLSPVHGGYGKPGLAPAEHRCEMAKLAAAASPLVMADCWEARQPKYQRTLTVLQHVQRELGQMMMASAAVDMPGAAAATAGGGGAAGGGEGAAAGAARAAVAAFAGAARSAQERRQQQQQQQQGEQQQSGGAPTSLQPMPPLRVMLLCGADLVESMAVPGVWLEPQLRRLLSEHGVVAIARDGSPLRELLDKPGSILHEHHANIIVVDEPLANNISSTLLREQLQQGRPIRYLTPDAVIQYIERHGLYR